MLNLSLSLLSTLMTSGALDVGVVASVVAFGIVDAMSIDMSMLLRIKVDQIA